MYHAFLAKGLAHVCSTSDNARFFWFVPSPGLLDNRLGTAALKPVGKHVNEERVCIERFHCLEGRGQLTPATLQ